MERKVNFVEGEFYHLYNRGVDKRIIYSTVANYKRFMMLLYLVNSTENIRLDNIKRGRSYEEIFSTERGKPLVAIGAFCLMPNHFHILATPLIDGGLSKFMLKIQTGYSMYFNKLNERTGSLFQGPFRSEHVGEDEYLKYLFAYIHLNPAKLKIPNWKERSHLNTSLLTKFIAEYPYSSMSEYLKTNHKIINSEPFPVYFADGLEILENASSWFKNRMNKSIN